MQSLTLALSSVLGATALLFALHHDASAETVEVVNDQCFGYVALDPDAPATVVRLRPTESQGSLAHLFGERAELSFSVRVTDNSVVALIRDGKSGTDAKGSTRIEDDTASVSVALQQRKRPRAWIHCRIRVSE